MDYSSVDNVQVYLGRRNSLMGFSEDVVSPKNSHLKRFSIAFNIYGESFPIRKIPSLIYELEGRKSKDVQDVIKILSGVERENLFDLSGAYDSRLSQNSFLLIGLKPIKRQTRVILSDLGLPVVNVFDESYRDRKEHLEKVLCANPLESHALKWFKKLPEPHRFSCLE